MKRASSTTAKVFRTNENHGETFASIEVEVSIKGKREYGIWKGGERFKIKRRLIRSKRRWKGVPMRSSCVTALQHLPRFFFFFFYKGYIRGGMPQPLSKEIHGR